MSTNTEARPAGSNVSGVTGSGNDEFAGCVAQAVSVNKVMDVDKRDAVWAAIYREAGIQSKGEDVKKSLRCAVYMYLAQNATSPSGTYKGSMLSGKGTKLAASIIPEKAGRYEVRQFARSNAEESLRFFRKTHVLEDDEAMHAKCEEHGMPYSDAIAFVDWLDLAIGLTPTERDAQQRLKAYSLDRARRSRGGKDLGQLRAETEASALNSQGPMYEPKAAAVGW